MESEKNGPATIDDYIKDFPPDVREKLIEIRNLIKSLVPEAKEKISYQMPTFTLNGNLVHFAAFKNHIGFYPTPSGIAEFNEELSVYKSGKGSAQFPLEQPLPIDLITKIVKYRVEENLKKNKK